MGKNLRTKAALVACLALTSTPGLVRAETNYISDKLTVPLRSGPSGQHRILHRGLPSGTELTVLERDRESGFARVRTNRGTEGWVRTQYLVTQPIARDQLAAAQRSVQTMQRSASEQAKELDTVQKERDAISRTNRQLTAELNSTREELTEIKRISAGAIEEHADNQRLTELNGRLRKELDEIIAENDRLAGNAQRQWMLLGAGLILLGLLLGVIIKARPRRSAWQ